MKFIHTNLLQQSRILWCSVAVYASAWTLLTFVANKTIPGGDAIEAFNWAANLDWGTPRGGWLVGLAISPALNLKSIAARSLYWYFVHFAGVGIGIVGVWKLALRLTNSPKLAWLAVFALNLNVAVSTDAQNQNDNYLLVMLWPWLFYFFIRAIFDNSRLWLPFALISGAATMAKYSTIAFVWSAFVLTLIRPSLRRSYREPWIYLAIAIFFLMVAPNVFWLWRHDFVAIHWFADDSQGIFVPSTIKNILVTFTSVLLPAAVLRLMGIRYKWPASDEARSAIICMLLPLALILTYLIFFPTSNPSRITEWLRPFSVLGPPLFVPFIFEAPDPSLRKAFFSLATVGCAVFIGYGAAKAFNFRNTYYRGSGAAEVGEKVQELWHKRYNAPLYYVGGSNIANMAAFYASDFPAVLRSWSNVKQPNVFTLDLNASEVHQHGALIIEYPGISCEQANFSETLESWPGMHIDSLMEISFRDSPVDPVMPLCLAFVAPPSTPPKEPLDCGRESAAVIAPRSQSGFRKVLSRGCFSQSASY